MLVEERHSQWRMSWTYSTAAGIYELRLPTRSYGNTPATTAITVYSAVQR